MGLLEVRLATIMDTIGGNVEVELAPPPRVRTADVGRERGRVRGCVRRCARCPLRASTERTVPFAGPSWSPGVAGFSLVGEGPGSKETEVGEPFVGPSGKLLRALVNEAGFDWDDVFRLNTVQCWPREGVGGTRAPSEDEMAACRRHVFDQLEVGGWQHVLLVGATALKAFRSDLRVSDVHGMVFIWRGTHVIMPIYHPAAILRNKTLGKPTRADLQTWLSVVAGDKTAAQSLGMRCVRCGEWLSHYDPDGVPYCADHWERWKDQWQKDRGKWDGRMRKVEKSIIQGNQEKML